MTGSTFVGGGVVVSGSTVIDFHYAESPRGLVQAFDSLSGELRWSFDPVPRNAGDPAAAEWTAEALARTGGANVWSMMSVDPELGLVYLPTTEFA